MNHPARFASALVFVAASWLAHAADIPPDATDWIDADTGHRIIRLSTVPGSRTLYFHDNSYTPQGDKLIFEIASGGIGMIDITKLGVTPPQSEIAIEGGRGSYAARRTREIYFVRGGAQGGGRGARGAVAPGAPANPAAGAAPAAATTAALPPAPDASPAAGARGGRGGGGGGFGGGEVFAFNVDTKAERKVPNATRALINADETFTLSTIAAEDPSGATPKPAFREPKPQLERMFPGKKLTDLTPEQQYAVNKEEGLARRAVNPTGMAYIFTNLKTGEAKTVGYQYGSLNHMQFSPTDPTMLLYCYEGTWHEVDRVWTIRTDGTEQTLRHKRTMDMEIAGHEWWAFDGKSIWLDLQTPRSQVFWIAGVDLASGKETRYPVDRDAWSVHYNRSRDGTLFMGDGGDETQVAFSKNGMWINLFRPQADGTMPREKLVNMAKHNYVTGRGGVEPNGSITPDNKWVIFTGNFQGANHVYAVEIAKAKK